jgi:hypothetical protein
MDHMIRNALDVAGPFGGLIWTLGALVTLGLILNSTAGG